LANLRGHYILPDLALPAGFEEGMLIVFFFFFFADIFLANLLGVPGLTLPVGFEEGLPIGLHLMADHWHEAELLKAAHTLETHHLVRGRPPACNFVDVLREVGAHGLHQQTVFS